MNDARFARGVELFNKGLFFECHDVLEDLWAETHGDQKLFLQGLIQTAVGFYHFLNSNPKGAASQLSKGLAKLDKFCPSFVGIDLERFTSGVTPWLAAAQAATSSGAAIVPESEIPKLASSTTYPTKENVLWQP